MNAITKQLEQLNFMLIEMGALVERAVACAAKGFVTQDSENAKNVFRIGGEIEAKEKEIEGLCMKLLLRPLDPVQLRTISSVLHMIGELRKIGEQAGEISEVTEFLLNEAYTVDMGVLPDMARETINMTIDSIHALVHNDINMALAVRDNDDRVDDLFLAEKDMLIRTVREDAERASQALDFLMVAKYFERIGDHACDVAEWVIYSITGKHTDSNK
ncbi:MAG: phosphate signaling complex protein PhoU [Clostridia bacterium]|nr:phosphate signaling complex protein PhoU [Clostridia bacterium]